MHKAKIDTKFEVKNEVDDDSSVSLYLYGTIRKAYPWEEDSEVISSKQVRKVLDGLSGKVLNVHINSGGGDVFESIAIHNLLKEYGGEVNTHNDSLAGSGASLILMAGKNRYGRRNSTVMIHKAWTAAMGNSDDLRKAADDLDKIDEGVIATYEDNFVGTREELVLLLKDESFLTANECLDFGFYTELIDDSDPAPQNNIKETLLSKYGKHSLEAGENKPAFFNAFIK